MRSVGNTIAVALVWLSLSTVVCAQAVCLPAPRLLTTFPMGGQAGTQVEVTITGDHLDEAGDLVFSDTRLTAVPKLKADGSSEPNKYVVSIAADCPVGAYEARIHSRLGLSSSRIFSVGQLQEVSQSQPNTTLAGAQEIPVNSICNGSMSVRAADHYKFAAKKDQRIVVDCATRGIDSKLDAVVIIADEAGRDLLVERRGGVLDFVVPTDGVYVIKVHELTFKGGVGFFYRLGVWEQAPGTPIVRQPGTTRVNAFSWPPTGLPEVARATEVEGTAPQQITLPCDIAGSFFPAADVDVFEFDAKAGEEWWVEVASERLGRPTDPSIVVQHVALQGETEVLTDVAEFNDVPSPVKVSSNGYAYDGPPYDAGTADILGKLTIKTDGRHRLQLTDLFGGTRNDPQNVYRLVIRKAEPDFALVSWALHMELRNGDRNALSKPIALRGGATMALEVVAFRRDGFDGDIDLVLDGLPEGVTAQGLKIPAGQSRGLMLITAHQEAPRSLAQARFYGRAEIGGAAVLRDCRMASMAWPVTDAWGEFPQPRLVADVPVSVSGVDFAPLSIAPQSKEVIEATAGQPLKIPLVLTRRSEFSGATMSLKTAGAGFERAAAITLPLTGDAAEATLDLAALKTPPGDYQIAFYGSAVAKYRHRPDAVEAADAAVKLATTEVANLDAELKTLTEAAAAATPENKPSADQAVVEAKARQQAATAALKAATDHQKKVTDAAQPRDIADIVVSEPIAIRVLPAESK